MKEKSKRKIRNGLLAILVIIVVANVAIFAIDTVSVPVNNEATVAQVNGGNEAYVGMQTTHKAFNAAQNGVLFLEILISCLVLIGTINSVKDIERGDEETKESETKA